MIRETWASEPLETDLTPGGGRKRDRFDEGGWMV